MKLTTRQITRFLTQDWSHYSVIAFFGHAEDVMRHYRDQLIEQANIDTSDAFAYVSMSGAQIANDPSLLLNEAFSSSLMQKPRTICISGKATELGKAIITLCQPETDKRLADNRVWIIVEEVSSKSALLRQLSQCTWAAAVPCYEPNALQIRDGLRVLCQKHQLTLDTTTENLLLETSHQNWDDLVHSLTKLRLYVEAEATIRPEDVIACSDDRHHFPLLDFAIQAFNGDTHQTNEQLHSLLEQKISEIALIRQLMQHCVKLLRLQSRAQDIGLDAAINTHQPPIFFKQVGTLTEQCQRLSSSQLQNYLGQLIRLEIKHKTESPNPALLRQWLLHLTTKLPRQH